jgi:autotransporter-associated beta strand protein
MQRHFSRALLRFAVFIAAGAETCPLFPAQAQTFNLGGVDRSVDTLDGFTEVTNNGRGAAVLSIGANGASSTFAGTMVDGSQTFGLIKAGAGVLTLTGVNSQTGDVGFTYGGGAPILAGGLPISMAVTGGTLAINSGAALGGGGVAVSDATFASVGGGAVTVSNNFLIGVTAFGAATIDTTGGDIHIASTIGGYQPPNANIAQDGGLTKIGAGSLFLDAASGNQFRGGVRIQQGIVVISQAQDLGLPPVPVGNLPVASPLLTIAPGATLRTTADINGGFGGDISLSCAVAGNCGYANIAPDAGTTLTIDSAVAGAGGLNMNGQGTLFLTGAKTYAGGTLVSSGTLEIDDATAINAGAFGLGNDARLRMMANGLILSPTSFSLNGVGIIDTNGFNASIGAPIADGVSTGALIKDGTGALTLNAVSTYSGGTEVRAGLLAMGVNNALNPTTSLAVDSGASVNLGGRSLTVATITGPGTISGGGRGLSRLIVGGTDASWTYSGLLRDGAGQLSLTKQGAGTLTLDSANSFSGGVNLLGGEIVVANASALGSGAISMDDGTTLGFSVASMTLANAIAFTGVTDPTIDTRAGTVTVTNAITGASGLTKLGSGSLILTGASSYTGPTQVAQGVLEVDGSIVSPTTIAQGAFLSGVGTVGAINALSGATLAPGNGAQPYGALHATGNVSFAPGSVFSVALSPGGASLLTTTGSARLAGTVAVASSGGSPAVGSRYLILSAAGGVTGVFQGISVSGTSSLLPVLAYDPKDVYLAFSGMTPLTAQNSFQTLANDRTGSLVTYQVLANVLDAFNEQIDCSSCVSAFGAVGSLSAGVHGRYSISDELALLGGAAIAQYHSGEIKVQSSPIFLGALRYDKTSWGASRPFAEVGVAASPWQSVNTTRGYFDGIAWRQGPGAFNAESYVAFGKLGWVYRWSDIDEGSIYGGLSRIWQFGDSYAESGPKNILPATIDPGTAAVNVARVGAQWTHLFVPNLESQINLVLAQSFASQSGLSGSVLGFSNIRTTANNYTWAEYGLRLGYRVANNLVVDVFTDGTLGAQPIGATIHGGLGLRCAF